MSVRRGRVRPPGPERGSPPAGTRAPPLEGDVRVRDAPPRDGGEEPVALGRRADLVVQPLEQQEGGGQPVGAVDGRAFAVALGDLGGRSDQGLQVLRLEVVGAGRRPALQVQDGVEDRPTGVTVGAGERGGCGPAARAAAPDREPAGVRRTLGDQGVGDGRAVRHVDDSPLFAEPFAVVAAVAGGAAVVDDGDTDAARGEVGGLQVEDERRVAGGATVRPHDVRGQFALGPGAFGAVRRVDVRVDLAAVGSGERPVLRHGAVGRIDRVAVGEADHAGAAGRRVQLHDLGAGARARRDTDDPAAVHGEGVGPAGPVPGDVGEFTGLRVEDAQALGAPAVQDGDQPVLQRMEPAQPDLPQRPAELLAPGRQKAAAGHRAPGHGVGADALELPPAGQVGDEQETAVAVPLHLADRLVDIAHQGPHTGESTGVGDLGQHHHRAVPRHPGVVPGDPGGPPPVMGDLGPGDEPVAAVGELPYGRAVVGGRAVQRYGGQDTAYVGRPGAGELLQHAPHFAPGSPVRVHLRVHPAQSAAEVRDRGERPGASGPSGA